MSMENRDDRNFESDPIDNLSDGPWPGPIERPVEEPDIEIGTYKVPPRFLDCVKVKKHRKGSRWFRTASAAVRLNDLGNGRWDYASEVSILEGGAGLLKGVCIEGVPSPDGSLNISFHDATWRFGKSPFENLVLFGMPQREQLYWLVKIAGFQTPNIAGFTPDNRLRPFIYAVPLIGIKTNGKIKSLGLNDIGVIAADMDNIFNPLAGQLELHKKSELWNAETPKAFGVVAAADMLQAEELAWRRANLTADLLNFSARSGVSHWEDRYETETLAWDINVAQARIQTSDWIMLREVQEVKGWVRNVPGMAVSTPISLDQFFDRTRKFFDGFSVASIAGDVRDQAHGSTLSLTESTLISGIQRALHWYGIASSESLLADRFMAAWIALEAIVDCVKYPAFFGGPRKQLRVSLETAIDHTPYPSGPDLTKITREMLKGRLAAGDWPLTRKIEMFAKSFGIPLQKDDVNLVRDLGKLRNRLFHAGLHSINLSTVEVRRLEYLLERLIIAARICAYREIENEKTHKIRIGEIGPSGGAAPVFLDGKQVPYELRFRHAKAGIKIWEYLIEGRVYDADNSQIE